MYSPFNESEDENQADSESEVGTSDDENEADSLIKDD
jgi:hypothetical protein